MNGIGQSLQQGFGTFFSFIPQLIGAIVILVVGYVVARVLQSLATRVLQGMGFQGWMERGGIKQFFDRSQTRQTPLSIIGKLVFWLVFIIAINMAVEALGISQISAVLARFIAYIPQIIAAVLILVLATLLASFVAGIVRGANGSGVAGSIAQYGIIVFAAFAALTQLGIATALVAPTFLILLGAVALAAAIAFGLGGQGVAREVLQGAYSRRDEARQKIQEQRRRQQQSGQRSGSPDGGTRERTVRRYEER